MSTEARRISPETTDDLSCYQAEHAEELRRLLDTPAWRAALAAGGVDRARERGVPPGKTRDYIGTVVDQLLGHNRDSVAARIRRGERGREALLDALAAWPPDLAGRDPTLSFLGITLTTQCNFDPRCVYCNQTRVERGVSLDGWKRVVEEATEGNGGVGPYIYISGGEPLLLEDELWGDDGLIRFASERGAAVNVNTNATLLTPEVALRLIRAGLAKLHISIDTPEPALQEELFGGRPLDDVLTGIYNVQLARDLVGVTYPVIHTNCVLTARNVDQVPDLFALILAKRKQIANRKDPLYFDLFPHVIPVGGEENLPLRPDRETFHRFYAEIWPRVEAMWRDEQERLGVVEDQRGPMFGYFSNPFDRVRHEGGLDAYADTAAAGRYGDLALSRHCYVAPTQASFGPDGTQFRCGSHAIRRIHPVGRVDESGGLLRNVRASATGLDAFPTPRDCGGCALATLYINQAVEARLEERLDALLESGKGGGP